MSTTTDAPDPEGLEFEALLDAYQELLNATCGASIEWHRRNGWGADAIAGRYEPDVWTTPSALYKIGEHLEWELGVEFEADAIVENERRAKLTEILEAVDADVERALEGGVREEVEELYLGLRRLKNGE